ncbi:MAG: hypothetical protein M1821_001518 [Bathelium mastoideum]|nr:MAG: hypothetical protein M1821_001518 [Bathelium mastoideum]
MEPKSVECSRADATPGHKMGLTSEEEEILRRHLHSHPIDGMRRTVFSYASTSDIVVMVVSIVASVIAGALNPLLTIIYGQLVGVFQNFSNNTISGSALSASVNKFSVYFVYLALGEFVFVYIATIGFYHVGERIVRRLRRAYLESIIRQNMTFFDMLGSGEVTTRITSSINLIHEGITSKLSLSLTAAATFITAFVIAFVEYWKLALILTSVIAAMALVGTTGGKSAVKYTKRAQASYGTGAAVAEESIRSIRHVAAFGIQDVLADKYMHYVLVAEKHGIKAGVAIALMIGVMHGIPYLSYGLTFWQGSRFVAAGDMSGHAVVTTTLAIVIGAFAIGKVTPNAQAFVSSLASATDILAAISRQSAEDPLSRSGVCLEKVDGVLSLRNIKLVYPSRDDVVVLENLDLDFPAGKTTAIVGPSGCGKSSIFGLIERFYPPVRGQINLDGHDIGSLNLRWLRGQIGYISQEPTLFNTTIFENIRFGLSDEVYDSEILKSLVIAAARSANAHDFIQALPNGYETGVGESGLQLSGGQRQRIAIARAIIGQPKILLLDEATSALDVKSEHIVQQALESASKGRTTIVVAHRLSTIKRADNIIVMSQGSVVEQGQHDALMTKHGVYAHMVEQQRGSDAENSTPDTENSITEVENSTRYAPSGWTRNKTKEMVVVSESDSQTEHDFVEPSISTDEGHSPVSSRSSVSFWGLMKLVFRLVGSERWIICLGLCSSIIVGLGTPVQSIFFAHLVDALSLSPASADITKASQFWCLMYLMLGLVAFAARSTQGLCFSFVAEKLTLRARDKAMRSILRQDIEFFDEKEHSTGALTGFLSTGTANLHSLSGEILGSFLSFTSTIAGGIILSLVIGWKLALVCSATIPLVAGCGWVRLKILALFDDKIKKTQDESAGYASEAINSVRTVASLGLELHVLDHYSHILSRQASKSLHSILQASALYAASQSVVFLCAALGFWYGGNLIASGEYTMIQFFICFAALISGSQSAGAIFSFAPDLSKAMHAGRDLNVLLDSRPAIDSQDGDGQPVDEKFDARFDVTDVSFRYPSRAKTVLQNFSLSVLPGQNIALVGPSGCGKSTVISLLERFYNPSSGCIRFNGNDISTLKLDDYRGEMSLVSQEPTVYHGTVRENIVLGAKGVMSDESIVQACKEANIFDFITSLPDGFSTIVGSRGTLLSGGQKQRIAIARALLRNPRILLLDEATSALDSESERVVQDALDSAVQTRTTITIAHRLSTVQKADLICVLERGQIVESGTHQELMARGQAYFQLVQMQNGA